MRMFAFVKRRKAMIYIHYGAVQYNPELFKPISNRPFSVKPHGGLWASSIDAKFGWKDWCEAENFRECLEQNSFRFRLRDDANIIKINSKDDCSELPIVPVSPSYSGLNWLLIDFEQLVKDGVDVIQVNMSNDDRLYWALYGWDCDSILVMNKDVIGQI